MSTELTEAEREALDRARDWTTPPGSPEVMDLDHGSANRAALRAHIAELEREAGLS